MVADVLGHKDVNTTVKHYAAVDEEHRKSVANYDLFGDNENNWSSEMDVRLFTVLTLISSAFYKICFNSSAFYNLML